MQKTLLLAVALFLSAFAIQAKDASVKITKQDLPKAAQTFLDKNFENIKIKKAVKVFDDNQIEEYVVTLKNKMIIEFDMVGAWNEVVAKPKKAIIPRFIYPIAVREAIDKDYSDKKIVKVENDGVKYEFDFSDGTEAEIDAAGRK